MTTFQPRLESSIAVAAPMPDADPVTIAVFLLLSIFSLDGGDWGGWRSHCTGQTERRGGEEETVALVLAQPVGERREIPQLAEMDAVLEQAVFVQRQHRVRRRLPGSGGEKLHGIVVGGEHREPRIRNPLQQLLVAAVEAGAGVVQRLGRRVLLE